METSNQLHTFRTAGIALLVSVVLFMIGAFSAAYFRKVPIPTDPLEQLTLIANDRVGWTAQAIIFPIALLATAGIFGVIAAQLPGPWPRWLAIVATILFAAGALVGCLSAYSACNWAPMQPETSTMFDPAAPPPATPTHGNSGLTPCAFWLPSR